ncbi:MAG: cytochrome P450 [Candidatus Pacebacteria bacterium]|nr:cytochrome P450 [Candidatus Paceibacterota bacterium]
MVTGKEEWHGIDLSKSDSFAHGIPFGYFAHLRQHDPLHWTVESQGRGFWSLTRHADIVQLNRDYRRLSSAQGIRIKDQSPEEVFARRNFHESDPPDHTRQRLIVSRAFSQSKMLEYEQELRGLTRSIIAQAIDWQEFDLAEQIARHIPMLAIGRILGLPAEDHEWLLTRAEQLFANGDPDHNEFVRDRGKDEPYRPYPFGLPAGIEVFDYSKLLLKKMADQGESNSLLQQILMPDDNGNTISEEEFRNFFCLIIVTANDTLRYTMAAMVLALIERPELAQLHREYLPHPDNPFWDSAVEEWVRYSTPNHYFRRTATRDFDLHGKTIRAGDKVVSWLSSANYDDAVFVSPSVVNPLRSPNPHLAFGEGGPHNCLGAWLARLELKLFLQEWVARNGAIELTAEPEWVRSNFLNGIKRLPIRILNPGYKSGI